MSFDLSHEVPENMQGIIKSAVDIVNDDFDYYKFAQAFSQNDTWNTKPKSLTTLSPEKPVFRRNDVPVQNDSLRSCPSFRQPVFTFDEASLLQKESQLPSYGIQRANSSSSDKLKQVMNENNIRQAIAELGNKNGVDLGVPILKVQLTGNPSYELDESDILNLFSRYGKVIRIEVGRNRSAFIVFDDIITALFAQKSLNGQYVKQLDVTIYVNWSSNIEEEFLRTLEENKQQQMTSSNVAPGIYNTNFASPKNFNNVVPTFSYNPAKFTCKYEVQIENDKDFKIARKIIGPKGCNMKKVIEICQYHLKRADMSYQSDFLKLRLRGRGSGFKEGPEQRESDEPLHLCVSSKYSDVYNLACKLVEDLLAGLYKEYEGFCQKAGRPLSRPVQIKRSEVGSGNERKMSDDKAATPRSRQNSIDNHLCQGFSKAVNVGGGNSPGQTSTTNSLSSLSDREMNSSPPKQNVTVLCMEEVGFNKSP